MKIAPILIAAIALLIPMPAFAQPVDPAEHVLEMEKGYRQFAAKLGNTVLDANEAQRSDEKGRGAAGLNLKDHPWRLVTQETMDQARQDPWLAKESYSLTIAVDYDGDGHDDIAQMYNSGQFIYDPATPDVESDLYGGVIVHFGGPKAKDRTPQVAYVSDQGFLGAEEIYRSGDNRILLVFPDSRMILLFRDGRVPKAIVHGE